MFKTFKIIKVTIKIHGYLSSREKICLTMWFNNSKKLDEFPNKLNINPEEIGIYIVNGKIKRDTYMIKNGDCINIYPFAVGG